MGWRARVKPWLLDVVMRRMDPLRVETVSEAEGDVLEIGFGTGLNLRHYGPAVKTLVALDPMDVSRIEKVQRRIRAASFPIERKALRADGGLPFDRARFDSIVTTWTLCSIPDVVPALREMRRVLKPGGRFVFVEHGRAESPSTARWQDRIDPIWTRVCDGCHLNRPIDRLVEEGGFEITRLDRFRGDGPGIVAQMFRGVATR